MTGSGRTVVVGVDGSTDCLAALRWAAEEADARGMSLLLVYALDPRRCRRAPYAPLAPESDHDDMESRIKAAEAFIERSAPERAESVVEVGVPSEILVRHARHARLLVLGRAEHRSGPALGWISRACVSRSACPVVVVSGGSASSTENLTPVQQPSARALGRRRQLAHSTVGQ